MVFLLGAVGIVVVIILIFAMSQARTQNEGAAFESRMASRIPAYREYLRREASDTWKDVSDIELDDLIASAMRLVARDLKNARSMTMLGFWFGGAVVTVIGLVYLETMIDLARAKRVPNIVLFGSWLAAVFGVGFIVASVVGAWQRKKLEKFWNRGGWEFYKLIV